MKRRVELRSPVLNVDSYEFTIYVYDILLNNADIGIVSKINVVCTSLHLSNNHCDAMEIDKINIWISLQLFIFRQYFLCTTVYLFSR